MNESATAPVLHATAVISTLDGVTTVLVAFLFVCLLMPSVVKNKSQYYAGLAMIVGVLLLHTASLIFNQSESALVAIAVFTGLLQIVALLVLVLCVGGLTAGQLAGDMARAYEVIRRGETTKEVIIPIAGRVSRERGESEVGGAPRQAPPARGPFPGDAHKDEAIPLE